MEYVSFYPISTLDNKTQFTVNGIMITVAEFLFFEGRHEIVNPESAVAKFTCNGHVYNFRNIEGYLTVEDWYAHELLGKRHAYELLPTNIAA